MNKDLIMYPLISGNKLLLVFYLVVGAAVAQEEEILSDYAKVDINPDLVFDHGEGARVHSRGKRDLNQIEINAVLNHHNFLRRIPRASNMRRLRWNPLLARMAQAWAERCEWTHGQPAGIDTSSLPYSYIGQNNYASIGAPPNGTAAAQAWYNEVRWYNLAGPCATRQVCGTCTAPTGRSCGHYTQVVWANTYELGCGYAYCNPLINSGWTQEAVFYVCNYGPGGNIIGQYPYTTGSPCSDCDPNIFQCDDGLCYMVDAPLASEATTLPSAVSEGPTTGVATAEATGIATATTEVPTAPSGLTTDTESPGSTAQPTQEPVTGSEVTTPQQESTVDVMSTDTMPPSGTDVTVTGQQTTGIQDETSVGQTGENPTGATGTTMSELTTEGQDITTRITTPNFVGIDYGSCDSSMNGTTSCPNTCSIYGKTCCSCNMTSPDYQLCTCCPRGYSCCPTLASESGSGACCPQGTMCTGRGTCAIVTYTRAIYPSTIGAPPCTENTVLMITCAGSIDRLYFDRRLVPYSAMPNRHRPSLFDSILLPGYVRLIALRATSDGRDAGILARSSDGRISEDSNWRCEYFSGLPPLNWMDPDYDDSRWPEAGDFSREGILDGDSPFWRIAPRGRRTRWFWPNFSGFGSLRNREVYCRLRLPVEP